MDAEWCALAEAMEFLGIKRSFLLELLASGRLVGERDPDDGRGRWRRISTASVLAHAAGRDAKRNCRRCHLVARLQDGLCAVCRWEMAHEGRHIYYPLSHIRACGLAHIGIDRRGTR